MFRFRQVLAALGLLIATGCSPMDPKTFADAEPKFVLEEYFIGETRAWGLFEDVLGTLRRQFVVEITGTMEDGVLVLDERFLYADGERQRRVWRITPLGDGRYEGRADDIVGVAQGHAAGNALNWRYQMDLPVGDSSWRVTFDDWMFLQPGGVMLNRARVKRWGLPIGSVTLAFSKPGAEVEALIPPEAETPASGSSDGG